MDIDIRKHICSNFKDSKKEEVADSIISSIESKEEVVLPGLGVLFELLWKNSDQALQENILTVIDEALKK